MTMCTRNAKGVAHNDEQTELSPTLELTAAQWNTLVSFSSWCGFIGPNFNVLVHTQLSLLSAKSSDKSIVCYLPISKWQKKC